MSWRLKFTVLGAPRTKKTHSTIVTRGKVRLIPSSAWQKWARRAVVRNAVDANGYMHVAVGAVCEPVNCCAIFYRDARRGDAVGYYQGLADLLELRSVLEDDKWIVSWDGSRLEVDRKNPRVEVELRPAVPRIQEE